MTSTPSQFFSRSSDGDGIQPSGTVARVTLRPLGSSLPLGSFALVPPGLLLSGSQLGWFAMSEMTMVAIIIAAFAFPLQLIASVLAFLARDALVGTSFAVFSGIWLAYSLTLLFGGGGGEANHVLGVFFLSAGALFLALMSGGLVGGKTAAGAVIAVGSARFLLGGLYEVTGSTGVEHAAGIVGLVFSGVALYVGVATLLEDSAHRSILPIGRRGRARAAFESDLSAQIDQLEHEAGVRDQL